MPNQDWGESFVQTSNIENEKKIAKTKMIIDGDDRTSRLMRRCLALIIWFAERCKPVCVIETC